MSFEWSFSGERSFNRCQRQFFFREFVAHHSAKDPVRRECFVLKQLKTIDQWQGLLVHKAIETMVVPLLPSNTRPDWDRVIAGTVKMAGRQREFIFTIARDMGMTAWSAATAGGDFHIGGMLNDAWDSFFSDPAAFAAAEKQQISTMRSRLTPTSP